MSRRAWTTLTGFIRAQAIVGLVDAVAIGIGLVVLGVRQDDMMKATSGQVARRDRAARLVSEGKLL